MKEDKNSGKPAENNIEGKQSAIDKAANIAQKKNDMSNAEDIKNRNKRDHSEKVSGKGSNS